MEPRTETQLMSVSVEHLKAQCGDGIEIKLITTTRLMFTSWYGTEDDHDTLSTSCL